MANEDSGARRGELWVTRVLCAVAVMFSAWTGDALSQSGERFREITDAATGIRLSLPVDIMSKQTKTKWGTNWSASDRSVNLDTLAYPEDQDFKRLYDNLKGIRGRTIERDTFTDNSFTLAGRDADGSRFHVEMRRQGAKIRGWSLVYSARSRDMAARVIERLAGNFEAYPGSGAATADASGARGQSAPEMPALAVSAPRSAAISVQPNLGEIGEEATVQFAPNGRYLAVGDRDQIKLWDIASGRPLRLLEHTAYFQHFAFIDRGERILSVHKDAQVRTWDPATGRLVHTASIGSIEPSTYLSSLAHHPELAAVVITPWNGPIVIWDYNKNLVRGKFVFDKVSDNNAVLPDAALLSRDGRFLIAAGGNLVKRFDTTTGRVISTIRLRADLKVVTSGVVGEGLIVAKTADTDCDADLVLVGLADSTPRYATLDRAPKCKRKSDGELDGEGSHGAIVLARNEAKGLAYISRRGASHTKVLDLAGISADLSRLPMSEVGGSVSAVDQSASLAALNEGQALRIVRIADGNSVSVLRSYGSTDFYPIASADGRQIMLHHRDGQKLMFSTWPIAGIVPRVSRAQLPPGFSTSHAVPDGNMLLAADDKSSFILHSTLTGEQIAKFSLPDFKELYLARLSPDGSLAMIRGDLHQTAPGHWGTANISAAYLVETRSGRVLHKFMERRAPAAGGGIDSNSVTASAFTADGRRLAVGWLDGKPEIWNIDPPRLVKRLDAADDQTTSLNFSPDNRFLIGGSRDAGIYVWSMETGKLLRNLERAGVAGHVSTGSVGISHDSELVAAGPRQRATSSGDVGRERRVQVWNMATGKPRFLLSGHEANVNALAFTPDGRWLVSGSNDGTIRYWDRGTGRLGATYAATPDARWVIVTDKGYFAASANAGNLLSVVRGYEATSIEQMWQSLYAPDLVREYIGGDPNGEVKVAEANASLEKVLESGPTPDVAVIAPATGSKSAQDLIEVRARIIDKGKGVGRVEWRVNGVTAGVVEKPEGVGPEYTLSRQLALDPSENTIEVVAYNGSNLLASLPARVTVTYTGAADSAKPRLHVLAIGINEYTDEGLPDTRYKGFGKLTLAVKDAETLGAELKRTATGLYAGEPNVVVLRDTQATREGIVAAIDTMARDIHPRDTFVLFAAGHGISKDGRFYLIPQDHKGGDHRVMLKRHAIGQEMLQDWLANRVKAKRALILLDTCESGALIAGHLRARSEQAASEVGIGRLHETTGRPVLTAAATGEFARGGLIGTAGVRHGVFTWALLDALRNGDTNRDGNISLSELVQHVQTVVPREAKRVGGIAEARGSGDKSGQSARFGSRGEDFAIVRALR